MKTKENKNEIKTLIHAINHAAKTYKEVNSDYSDKNIEQFLDRLVKHHTGFIKRAADKEDITTEINVKNQLNPGMTFEKGSAVDLLILCMNMEKEILYHAREAVHSSNGDLKKLVCKQLIFSEKALFSADAMLENYE